MSTDLFLLARLLLIEKSLKNFSEIVSRSCHKISRNSNVELVISSVAWSEFFHLRLLRTIELFFLKPVFYSTAFNKCIIIAKKVAKTSLHEGISLASLHEYYFFRKSICLGRNIFLVGKIRQKTEKYSLRFARWTDVPRHGNVCWGMAAQLMKLITNESFFVPKQTKFQVIAEAISASRHCLRKFPHKSLIALFAIMNHVTHIYQHLKIANHASKSAKKD